MNEDWAEGMGSSLRRGLYALESAGRIDDDAADDAALVLLVDQPFVGPQAVRAVLDAWRDGPGRGAQSSAAD